MIKKSKTLTRVVAAAFCSLIVLSSLVPLAAQAQAPQQTPSGDWVNKGTIKVGNDYLVDQDTTDRITEYTGTSSNPAYTGCEIKLWLDGDNREVVPPVDGFTATLPEYYYSNKANDEASRAGLITPKGIKDDLGRVDCSDTNNVSIQLRSPENRRVTFIQLGAGKIIHFQNSFTFSQKSGSKLYIRDGDPNGKCKDLIYLANARSDDELNTAFNYNQNVGGSSILYAVGDGEADKTAETYGKLATGTAGSCGIEYEDITGNGNFATTYGDTALEHVRPVIAKGIELSGGTVNYFNSGDRRDDAFTVFVGDESNLPKDKDGEVITPAPSGGSATAKPVCAIDNNFGWMLCPLVFMSDKILAGLESLFDAFLPVAPLTGNTADPVYRLWDVMRNLANVAFIIAFFIVIFSQATSVGITNYGIKRTLPRMVVVVILVNTSYYLCAAIIDAANVLGFGIQSLIIAILGTGIPISSQGLNLPPGTGAFPPLAVAGLGGGILLVLLKLKGIEIIIGPIIIGVLLVLIALLCLILRLVIINLLVVLSPLIAVGYLLPNTERVAAKGLKLFIQLNIWYLLIKLLFGVGQITATLILAISPTGLGPFGAVVILGAAIASKLAVLGLVPVMFTAGGGAMAGLFSAGRKFASRGGALYENSRGKKLRDQTRENVRQKAFLDRASGGGGWRGRATRAGMRAAMPGSLLRMPKGVPLIGGKGFGESSAVSQQMNENLESARRKLDQERVGNIQQRMTMTAANVVASGEDVSAVLQGKSSKFDPKGLTAADRNALEYIQQTGHAKTQYGALAAMETLMAYDDQLDSAGGNSKISSLAGIAARNGYSDQFTEQLSAAAAKGKHKDFMYGGIDKNGTYQQYMPGGKDAGGIVDSGVDGVSKETLQDQTILAALTHRINNKAQTDAAGNIMKDANGNTVYTARTQAEKDSARQEFVRQTLNVSHEKTKNGLATALGYRTVADFETDRKTLRAANLR